MDAEFRKLVTMFERAGNKTGHLEMFSAEELKELIFNAAIEVYKRAGVNIVYVDCSIEQPFEGVFYKQHVSKRFKNYYIIQCPNTNYYTPISPNGLEEHINVTIELLLNNNTERTRCKGNTLFVGTNYTCCLAYTTERTKEEIAAVEAKEKILLETKKKAEEKRKQTRLKQKIKSLETKLNQTDTLKKQLEEARKKASEEGVEI